MLHKGSSTTLSRRRSMHPMLNKGFNQQAQRLIPSLLFTSLIIVSCLAYAEYSTFPDRDARLFPDMPPAVATVGSIVLLNTAVLIAWRIPPLWRILNTYFITVPGFPYAFSVLGNVFSHQLFSHYAANMLVVWFVGTRCMDFPPLQTFSYISFLPCFLLSVFPSLLSPFSLSPLSSLSKTLARSQSSSSTHSIPTPI